VLAAELISALVLSRYAKRRAKTDPDDFWIHFALLPIYEVVLILKKLGLIMKDIVPYYWSLTAGSGSNDGKWKFKRENYITFFTLLHC
jgi:hypothetical protein